MKPLSLGCSWLPSPCVLTWLSLHTCMQRNIEISSILSSYKDTSSILLSLPHTISFNFSYQLKNPNRVTMKVRTFDLLNFGGTIYFKNIKLLKHFNFETGEQMHGWINEWNKTQTNKLISTLGGDRHVLMLKDI